MTVAGVLTLVAFFPSPVQAASPVVFERDGHCPPNPLPAAPVAGKDLFTPGSPPTAWLVRRYHWDDGHGNDLTVDSFCMTNGNYMSIGITQSRNEKLTVVAWPGGTAPDGSAVADPGFC